MQKTYTVYVNGVAWFDCIAYDTQGAFLKACQHWNQVRETKLGGSLLVDQQTRVVSQQPVWELVRNIGDASPADYGGFLIYRDTTGVYCESAEVYQPFDDSDEPHGGMLYRFDLERLKECGCSCGCKKIRNVTYTLGNKSTPETTSGGCYFDHISQYDLGLPYPIHTYGEWFWKDLQSVANFADWKLEELREALRSEDPVERAQAYRSIADYHGYENFDSYPLTLTEDEAQARYAEVSNVG